jgi:hypothetical protein
MLPYSQAQTENSKLRIKFIATINSPSASMKEIIKGAIVIHPAFRSEVTLVTVKKSRVFVMLLKFNQRTMVSLCECAKPLVIAFASRP